MRTNILFLFIFFFAVVSCKKKENPFDPGANVDFSPKNVTAQIVSPYVLKLNWEIPITVIDEIRIDRKENDGEWINNIAPNLGNASTSWIDYYCKPNTNYSYRIYAIAGVNTSDYSIVTKKTSTGNPTGTFTDNRDGRIYKWVQIGNQVWMAENLAYIPFVCPAEEVCGIWVAFYNGNDISEAKSTDYYQTYGCLYDWTNAKQVCPEGWHLPSIDEWFEMLNYLGGSSIAGDKLRETSREHWSDYLLITSTTNESGFTAFAGGYASQVWMIGYHGMGSHAYFWTSDGDVNFADYYLIDNTPVVKKGYDEIIFGYSIRCIRD